MITATLTVFERVRDEWRISILYTDTDTDQTLEKNYRRTSVTKKQLRDLARREALAYDANDVTDMDIPIGTTIDVTPDVVTPPDPPTQAELDRIAWFTDYRKLQAMLEVTANVPALETAQAQTAIANYRATLESGWNNGYLDGIR